MRKKVYNEFKILLQNMSCNPYPKLFRISQNSSKILMNGYNGVSDHKFYWGEETPQPRQPLLYLFIYVPTKGKHLISGCLQFQEGIPCWQEGNRHDFM